MIDEIQDDAQLDIEEKPLRKMVTLRKIANINPVSGADFLELAIIDGWKAVVKKGDFKVGDYCLYFEIDSLIPDEDPEFSFIGNTKSFEGKRWKYIKTIKLRGQISQGLAIPVDKIDAVSKLIDGKFENFIEFDFSEMFSVVKYEEPSDLFAGGDAKGTFPYYIQKTGENRIQNTFRKLQKLFYDVEFTPTLKMDGSSMTACYTTKPEFFVGQDRFDESLDGQFWVGSHNLVLKKPLEIIGEDGEIEVVVRKNGFYHAAEKAKLEEKLRDWVLKNGKQIAIQGELLGPKIQGNFEKFNDFTFRAFYIYLIDENRRACHDEFKEICKELDIETVIEYHPMKVFQIFDEVDQLLEFAEGESEFNPQREGLVFKSNKLVNGQPVSFKVISNSFLLGKK